MDAGFAAAVRGLLADRYTRIREAMDGDLAGVQAADAGRQAEIRGAVERALAPAR